MCLPLKDTNRSVDAVNEERLKICNLNYHRINTRVSTSMPERDHSSKKQYLEGLVIRCRQLLDMYRWVLRDDGRVVYTVCGVI